MMGGLLSNISSAEGIACWGDSNTATFRTGISHYWCHEVANRLGVEVVYEGGLPGATSADLLAAMRKAPPEALRAPAIVSIGLNAQEEYGASWESGKEIATIEAIVRLLQANNNGRVLVTTVPYTKLQTIGNVNRDRRDRWNEQFYNSPVLGWMTVPVTCPPELGYHADVLHFTLDGYDACYVDPIVAALVERWK